MSAAAVEQQESPAAPEEVEVEVEMEVEVEVAVAVAAAARVDVLVPMLLKVYLDPAIQEYGWPQASLA